MQALQTLQELPLSLIAESPAHIPNWDLVADIVNGCSRTYRSPKQCKNRFENFIAAREEGRAVYDPSPRKMKKTVKGLYKVLQRHLLSLMYQINVFMKMSGVPAVLKFLKFQNCPKIVLKFEIVLKFYLFDKNVVKLAFDAQ